MPVATNQRGQGVRVDVADLAWPGLCLRIDQLVAARDDGHPQPPRDLNAGDAQRDQPAEILRSQHVAARQHRVADAHVLANLDHVFAGRDRPQAPRSVVGPTSCVCSTMTTASAPSGSMPPVAMRAHWPEASVTPSAAGP